MKFQFLDSPNFEKRKFRKIKYLIVHYTGMKSSVESLKRLQSKKYRVSRATLYNTIELLLECHLVRKHQFGKNQAQYEKSFFDKQHDHIILTDTGEVKEFCEHVS